MSEEFERQYEDVLQNIEFAIVSVAREQPQLLDFDVETALDALIRHYNAEEQNRTLSLPRLTESRQKVYDRVQALCDWRLGRQALAVEGQPKDLPAPPPKTTSEITACLKRIRKSVQRWNKQGGRQGYLNFVQQFIR